MLGLRNLGPHKVDLTYEDKGHLSVRTLCAEDVGHRGVLFSLANVGSQCGAVVKVWRCKCGLGMEATLAHVESESKVLTVLFDIKTIGELLSFGVVYGRLKAYAVSFTKFAGHLTPRTNIDHVSLKTPSDCHAPVIISGVNEEVSTVWKPARWVRYLSML